MAQAVHAGVEYALANPVGTTATPVVAVLEAKNEFRLHALADDLESQELHVIRFHEPDLDDELTSVAVITNGNKALRRLPLLFHSSKEGR